MITTIAWRNIWRNKTRSIVIMTSVALGLWAGAFIAAIYWGMGQERMRIAIENEIAHLQIHAPDFTKEFAHIPAMANAKQMEEKITAIQGVKAVAMRTIAMGMLANATGSAGVQINGIDPGAEAATSQLKTKLTAGTYFESQKANSVLIGAKLAKKLKLKLHAKVVLTFQDKEDSLVSAAFRVEGIYQSYNTALDERNVYVNYTNLNALLGLQDETHEIAILLQTDEQTPTVKAALGNQYPGLKVQDWKEVSPETGLILTTMSQASLIFVVIILLALAFGIINTMLMAVLERTREIGVLMALGMNKLKLFTMIVVETIMLVLAGSPFGLLLAWGVIQLLSKNGIDLTAVAGNTMQDFGFSNVIYPNLPANQYIQIIILVIIAAIISAFFPAYRALRLKPVEAIRG